MALPTEPQTASGKFDLGVLFIHGLGTQARGSTLVGWGQELHRCLSRWIAGASAAEPDECVRVKDACLGLPAGDASSTAPNSASHQHPPWTVWHVHSDASDAARRSEWLLAESWWARSFLEPSYTDLIQWSVQTVPWTLASHFGNRLRRAREQLYDSGGHLRITAAGVLVLTRELFLFALAIVFFPVLILLLLVVIVAGLIPKVRTIAVWLQRGLAQTVGDSFILLQSSIQRAAIVGQVTRDAEWLGARCTRIVLIAHSQGAAIALKCLREPVPANTAAMITFGSGIGKLLELEKLPNSDDRVFPWLGLFGFVLIGAGVPDVLSSMLHADWVRVGWAAAAALVAGILSLLTSAVADKRGLWPWAVICIACLMGSMGALVYILSLLTRGIEGPGKLSVLGLVLFLFSLARSWTTKIDAADLDRCARLVRPQWWDVHASKDPVSNGPIITPARDIDETADFAAGAPAGVAPPEHFEPLSFSVENRKSILTDHTTYWKNHDQFGVFVSRALLHVAGVSVTGPNDRPVAASARRRWRLNWLRFSRLYLVGWFIFLVTTIQTQSHLLPNGVLEFKSVAGKLTLWIVSYVTWVASILTPNLANRLAGSAWVLQLAILMFGGYAVLLLTWKLWDRADARTFLRREPFPIAGPWFVLYVAAHIVPVELLALHDLGWTNRITPGLVWAAGSAWTLALAWRLLEIFLHPRKRCLWPETYAFGPVYQAWDKDQISFSEFMKTVRRTVSENVPAVASKFIIALIVASPDCFRLTSQSPANLWARAFDQPPLFGSCAVILVVLSAAIIGWTNAGRRTRAWLEQWARAVPISVPEPAAPPIDKAQAANPM